MELRKHEVLYVETPATVLDDVLQNCCVTMTGDGQLLASFEELEKGDFDDWETAFFVADVITHVEAQQFGGDILLHL